MSKKDRSTQAPPLDTGKPFGTEPRRSNGPLFAILVLFLAWVGVLLWLAGTQVGMK